MPVRVLRSTSTSAPPSTYPPGVNTVPTHHQHQQTETERNCRPAGPTSTVTTLTWATFIIQTPNPWSFRPNPRRFPHDFFSKKILSAIKTQTITVYTYSMRRFSKEGEIPATLPHVRNMMACIAFVLRERKGGNTEKCSTILRSGCVLTIQRLATW
jgi:hypothetical protein